MTQKCALQQIGGANHWLAIVASPCWPPARHSRKDSNKVPQSFHTKALWQVIGLDSTGGAGSVEWPVLRGLQTLRRLATRRNTSKDSEMVQERKKEIDRKIVELMQRFNQQVDAARKEARP